MNEEFKIEIDEGPAETIAEQLMPETSGLASWGSPLDSNPVIFISELAYDTINNHIMINTKEEIGGVLVGEVYFCPKEKLHFVIVEAAIAANMTEAGGAHVTFTHETWAHIWNVIDERFTGKKILGWYHTHPGMGVFLSGADLFVHTNFFSKRWQVALVLDPINGRAAFFQWRDGKVAQNKGFYGLFSPQKRETMGAWNGPRLPLSASSSFNRQVEEARYEARCQATLLERNRRRLAILSIYAAVITIVLVIVLLMSAIRSPTRFPVAERLEDLGVARAGAGAMVYKPSGQGNDILVFGGMTAVDGGVAKSWEVGNTTNGLIWGNYAEFNLPEQKSAIRVGNIGNDYLYAIEEGYPVGGNATMTNDNWLCPINAGAAEGGNWTLTDKMPLGTVRYRFATVSLENYIYVIGGEVREPESEIIGDVITAELKTVSGGNGSPNLEWRSHAPALRFERADTAAVVFGDKEKGFVYVIGGQARGSIAFCSVERGELDPNTGMIVNWQEVRSLNTARAGAAATIVHISNESYILVGGGRGANGEPLESLERARINPDGSLDDWAECAVVIEPRYDLTAIAIGSDVYFIGGRTSESDVVATVQIVKEDQWKPS